MLITFNIRLRELPKNPPGGFWTKIEKISNEIPIMPSPTPILEVITVMTASQELILA
jgi:hypothetical protein